MKSKAIHHVHEETKIYKNYYRPSLNLVRFVKSIMAVLISGSSPATHGQSYIRRK